LFITLVDIVCVCSTIRILQVNKLLLYICCSKWR